MKEVIEYLKERIASINEYNEPMNSASWGYEEGCIVSGNDAIKIIEFYEAHKSEGEPLPNVPDITPEWDKIPEGFDWAAIDKNGEEYAYSEEPCRDGFEWVVNGIHGQVHITWRKFDTKHIDWTKTLSKRP